MTPACDLPVMAPIFLFLFSFSLSANSSNTRTKDPYFLSFKGSIPPHLTLTHTTHTCVSCLLCKPCSRFQLRQLRCLLCRKSQYRALNSPLTPLDISISTPPRTRDRKRILRSSPTPRPSLEPASAHNVCVSSLPFSLSLSPPPPRFSLSLV